MFLRIVLTAVIAGLAAGLFVTALQAARTVPLILEAETYERAAPATHHREDVTQGETARPQADTGWAPAEGWERTAFTFLANFLTATGFAALLASAFTLYGKPVTLPASLVWGLGGFAAFSFLPALGLPPELPGMVAGDLAARQFWWWSSVAANCVGLATLFFAPRRSWKAAGLVLVLVPLAVGAPQAGHMAGTVPPELAARFVMASLGTALLFWLALGIATAFVFGRLGSTRLASDRQASAGT